MSGDAREKCGSTLAPPSFVLEEHFVKKDLPFYVVSHLTDSDTCHARLEEREKKH